MENGELLADVVLPKMGEGLEKTFAGRVIKVTQTAQAEINRFMNIIDELKNKIAVGGALEKFTDTLERLGNYLSREDVGYELAQIASGLATLMDAIVRFSMVVMSLPREVIGFLFGGVMGGVIGGGIGIVGGPPGILTGAAWGSSIGAGLGTAGASLTRLANVEMPKILELKLKIEEVQKKINAAEVQKNKKLNSTFPGDANFFIAEINKYKSELNSLQQEYQELFKSEGGGLNNVNQMVLRNKELERDR
jgi:outer membrane lipoprotein SlyB